MDLHGVAYPRPYALNRSSEKAPGECENQAFDALPKTTIGIGYDYSSGGFTHGRPDDSGRGEDLQACPHTGPAVCRSTVAKHPR